MEVDLYQRRGRFGLGEGESPATDQPIPAYLTPGPVLPGPLSAVTSALSSGPAPDVSWSTLALLGIGAWIFLGAVSRGTSRAVQRVTRPLKRRRKKKQELSEARDSYEKRRRSIEATYSK